VSVFLPAYTRALRVYDRDLYAGLTRDGVACVFRQVKRFVFACEWEGSSLFNLVTDKQLVFALTDTWNLSGKPRDWGVDAVVGRVRKLDAWENKRFFEELDEENERVDERKRRHFRSEMEAFASENRTAFAKATDGILTHSLSKDEKRKRLKDRSIKNAKY
jgi:hypothetical protein